MENGVKGEFGCGCHTWRNANGLGDLHRLDGPAVEVFTRSCREAGKEDEYWIDGEKFTKEVWEKKIEEMRQDLNERIEEAIIKCWVWAIVQGNKEAMQQINPLFYEWNGGHLSSTARARAVNAHLERKNLL